MMTLILSPILIMFLLVCSNALMDLFPQDDTPFVKQLKQIDSYGFEYAHKIIEGDWAVICQLWSYGARLTLPSQQKYQDLNK
jgi:hypothetical protein